MITTEPKFRAVAVNAIVDYWNASKNLSKKYGTIDRKKVYVVWQVKSLQNFKALFAVNFEGDGMYFEVTYDGDRNKMYLDIYRKLSQRVLEC